MDKATGDLGCQGCARGRNIRQSELHRPSLLSTMSAIPETEGSLPSPPFIHVAGIPNFRDLGGYPIASAPDHSVRRDIIYRSAEPQRVTKDGIAVMNSLGITHIYDLRSNNEIERNQAAGRGGVVTWEGCERFFVPVFVDEDYSPEKIAIRFQDYASDGTEVYYSKQNCWS